MELHPTGHLFAPLGSPAEYALCGCVMLRFHPVKGFPVHTLGLCSVWIRYPWSPTQTITYFVSFPKLSVCSAFLLGFISQPEAMPTGTLTAGQIKHSYTTTAILTLKPMPNTAVITGCLCEVNGMLDQLIV